jgi:RHS repeat-associated core domain
MVNKFIKISILVILFCIITPVTAFADSVTDLMNNLIGPSQQYNTMVSPAYLRTNTSEYNISPQSGEMMLNQTDYSLPGRNGLDLNITRIYKSSSACAFKNSLKYQSGTYIDYVDNTLTYENNCDNSFYEMRYNIGVGFRFSFPTIEKSGEYLFLHTESGDVYRMLSAGGNAFSLENHPVQDITINTISDGSITSQCYYENGTIYYTMQVAYVMTEKNGKKTYFDSDGRILRIVDRYQNKITFDYVNQVRYIGTTNILLSKTLISKITDTVGRVVTIKYNEDPNYRVDTTSSNLNFSYNTVITLPNGKTIVYNKDSFVYCIQTLQVVRTRLLDLYDVDAVLPITSNSPIKYWYGYEQVQLGFTFLNGTNYSQQNACENITTVQYMKNNKVKKFVYGDVNDKRFRFVKPLSWGGYNGSMEYRKVIEAQDYDTYTNTIKNKVTYTYTNEPGGYTYNALSNTWPIYPGYSNDENYLKNTYRYYTELTDMRGTKTKFTYDGVGETRNTEKSGNDHKEISTTTYDSYKLPQVIRTESYNVINGAAGSSVIKFENFVYDQYGNLSQYTGPEAARDANGNPTGSTYTTTSPEGTTLTVNEHTVVYSYVTNKYHIITSKTWKKDPAITSRIEYTVNANGSITQESKIHSGNNIISDYLYDAYGNMTQKSTHYADNSGNTYITNFEYSIDADGIDQKGAYLTKEYSVIDGTEISKKHVYDFSTGNLIADLDERNNRTSYTYDIFNRLKTISYPNNSHKEYNYYDYVSYSNMNGITEANSMIRYSDPNGVLSDYCYDILGNLVLYGVWGYYDNVLTAKYIAGYEYDSNSNKIKEKDPYGNSTRFIYDSANRLIEKSFWQGDAMQLKTKQITYTIGYNVNTPLLVNITDEEMYPKKYYYDISNRLWKVEETQDKISFNPTIYSYDYVGNKISETDSLNHTTNYTFNDLNRLIQKEDARHFTTGYSYDAGFKLVQEINGRGKIFSYDYDVLGRLIRKKAPASDSTIATTRYIYDQTGNKTKEITPKYYVSASDTPALAATMTGMSYTYNNMNQIESVFSPEGSLIEIRKYDNNGNLKKIVDGLRYTGNIDSSLGTTYIYDNFNRIIESDNAKGRYKKYTYDLRGSVLSETNENGNTINYEYFPEGTFKKVTYPIGYIQYSNTDYDRLGHRLLEKDLNGNQTTYTYNGYGQVKTITDAKGNSIVYDYYANGNLLSTRDKMDNYSYYYYYDDNKIKEKRVPLEKNAQNTILYAIEDYDYDGAGNLTVKALSGTKDPSSSRITTYTYYDNNLPSTTSDNSGAYEKKYYDKNGNLIKTETLMSSGKNDISKYEYDNRDRKVKSIRLIDESDVYNASTYPNLSNIRDSEYLGKVQSITGYEYDIIGNLVKLVDPRAYGFLASDTTNRDKYIQSYTYDELNRLITVSKKYNTTDIYVKYYYDGVGNKKVEKNEKGFCTVYMYDSMNRLKAITDPETDKSTKNMTDTSLINLVNQETNTLIKTITFDYDNAGNKTAITNAKGYVAKFYYDSLNRLENTMAPYDPNLPDSTDNPYNRVVNRKIYDKNGNIIKEIDAKGFLLGNDDNARYGIEYTYDLANRLTTSLDPECKIKGLTCTMKYDYNQFSEKTKETDALNHSTSYSYYNSGLLETVKDPLTVETSYTYDYSGNMLTATNGKGKTTNYAYSINRLVKQIQYPDLKSAGYRYDLAFNTTQLCDRNGNATVYTYDSRNNLLGKSVVQTGDAVAFTYDETGIRITMSDISGTYSYTYDDSSRLKSVSKGGATQISYTYDQIGNVGSVTDSKNYITTYSYDTSNRMKTVNYIISGISKTTTYSYDENGNRKSVVYQGGVSETYSYDRNNKLLTLINKKPDNSEISRYTYTYYNNGLQNTKTDNYGTTAYTYDNNGRIEQIVGPGKTAVYTYDNAGNRETLNESFTSDQTSGYIDEKTGTNIKYRVKSSQYVYSDTNNLLKLVESMQDSSGLEVLCKATCYYYDNNGNQLTQTSDYIRPFDAALSESYSITAYDKSTTVFDNRIELTNNKFDGFNRLTCTETVESGNRSICEFLYNGDDLRVRKIVKKSTDNYVPEETNYLYDSQYVILETDAAGNVKSRYIRGLNYLAKVDSTSRLSYYLYNGHGDVMQTVTEAGIVENNYDFDIWGNSVLTVEQYSNAIRYGGEFYDTESGLYYLRARYYDSSIGRFLSEDTYAGNPNDPLSLNLYSYCRNDPVMYSDPSGHVYLTEGATGSDVQVVQAALGVPLTGVYDEATIAAVNEYKTKNKLGNSGASEGVVGDQTYASIISGRVVGYAEAKAMQNKAGTSSSSTNYGMSSEEIAERVKISTDVAEDIGMAMSPNNVSISPTELGKSIINNARPSDIVQVPAPNFDNAYINGRKVIIDQYGHIYVVANEGDHISDIINLVNDNGDYNVENSLKCAAGSYVDVTNYISDAKLSVVYGTMIIKYGSEGYTRTQLITLGRLENVVNNNLTPGDFTGTEADLQGKPIQRSDGSAWNHKEEMDNSYKSLRSVKKSLEDSLKNPKLDQNVKQTLDEALNKTKMYMDNIEKLYSKYNKTPGTSSGGSSSGGNSEGGNSGTNTGGITPIIPEIPSMPKVPTFEIPIIRGPILVY